MGVWWQRQCDTGKRSRDKNYLRLVAVYLGALRCLLRPRLFADIVASHSPLSSLSFDRDSTSSMNLLTPNPGDCALSNCPPGFTPIYGQERLPSRYREGFLRTRLCSVCRPRCDSPMRPGTRQKRGSSRTSRLAHALPLDLSKDTILPWTDRHITKYSTTA